MSEFEIYIQPAVQEKRFAVLYTLKERTCDIVYDKYDWTYTNHHTTNCGTFIKKESLESELEKLKQEWKKRGYSEAKDNPLNLSDKNMHHEVDYIIEKINIPLEQIIKKEDSLYLEYNDENLNLNLKKLIL